MTTPTPEAIEAASNAWSSAPADQYSNAHELMLIALTAAYPLMEASAKAEALREAAEVWGAGLGLEAFAENGVEDDVSSVQATVKWLDERATEIEGKSE